MSRRGAPGRGGDLGTQAEPILRAHELVVGHAGRAMLPPVSFEVARGELWAVLGKNGAGKTTLLRTLLGLVPPVSGAVRRAKDATLGHVPQRFSLDPMIPVRAVDLVREGVEHGLSFLSPARRVAARLRAEKALATVGADRLASRRYHELSDGERQYVLLARALAGDPDLLVLDEPTSAMDPLAERAMLSLLAGLRRGPRPTSVLLVCHALGLARELADCALFVDADERLVVAGRFHEVAEHPLFRARLGGGGGGEVAPAADRALA